MTAQIFNTTRNMFHSFLMNNEPPYIYEFYLGQSIPWQSIKNTPNEFISLGGSQENPISYKYQNDGVTDFTFSIIAPNSPRVTDLILAACHYELWIEGIKEYYFYFDFVSEVIFCRTLSVIGQKDQITKFKCRITYPYTEPMDIEKFLYFEGDANIIYSSITAKFIPEITAPPSPIIVLGTTQEIVPGVTHIIKSTSQCLLSLPATYPLGVSTKIISYNDNGYKILQKDGQVIKAVGRTTTIGTGGSMTFNDKYSQVNIDCVDANKTFVLNNITGGFLTV